MRRILCACLFFLGTWSAAQPLSINGTIFDEGSGLPLEGATVRLLPENVSTVTTELGTFSFKQVKAEPISLEVSSVGFGSKVISFGDFRRSANQIIMIPQTVELGGIILSSREGDQYRVISKTDIALRGVNNSQEILRIISGMVISQHQGGGKAEQIFLRGFDADHGTDFREDVDGLPINMVSHAHGQGFADSHFIIPETIEAVDFSKGPYAANKGDFATTGFVDFNTKNSIPNDLLKLEGGQFNTFRAVGMFNLLNKKAGEKQQAWYVAGEYRYSNSYFDNPQHFNRFNFFTKYHGKISPRNYLTVSATTFWSKWNASGQIPNRAVAEKIIGFYGALDPFEGGLTYRSNVNAQLLTSLRNGDMIKNQLYCSNVHFDLHTNFTFFLVDTINGDEIRQREARNLMGYNGSYNHAGFLGSVHLSSEIGLQVRSDLTHNAELSHTVDRYTLLGRIKLGNITELSVSPYFSEVFKFNEHLSINAGLRFDQFYNKYNNKLASDSTLPGIGIYRARANKLSPKLNAYYQLDKAVQFYLTVGNGFHSNDTRAVVVEHGYQVLPTAHGIDLGTLFKPAKNVIINAALWYINLEQEFVYGGDGGDVEFSGKTRRVGFDFSGRYEPVRSLYFDVDLNYAHGRVAEASKGQNFIPLAPVWTSTGGLTYMSKNGLNGSLRYRYVGDRPANEHNSLTATGYFITDAVLRYTKPKYELGLVVNNILNQKWKETQFATVTRLKGEAQPVDEICFTPEQNSHHC